MKTPTPQEQAEMLIEKYALIICGVRKLYSRIGKRMATKAAIVTVETVLDTIPHEDVFDRYCSDLHPAMVKYWQEVLTILKGKL